MVAEKDLVAVATPQKGQPELGEIVVLHIHQSGRYTAGQLVSCQVKQRQILQAAQTVWYLPGQLVTVEPQLLQVCEAAQFHRDLAAQRIILELQPGDAAAGFNGYSVPLAHRRIGQPAGVVGPASSAGGVIVIEGNQRVPLRMVGVNLVVFRVRNPRGRAVGPDTCRSQVASGIQGVEFPAGNPGRW